jgi:hypothetical protein
MKAFVMYKKARLEMLKKNFQVQLVKYRYDLSISNKKADKELLKVYHEFNEEYNDKVLDLYLERCMLR